MTPGIFNSWFSSPRAPSTIPSTVLQQPRTILITMSRCTFTHKNGLICPCTSGSCTSKTGANTTEERCEDCDHLMSIHADYGKSIASTKTCRCRYLFIVPPSLPPPKERLSIQNNPYTCPRTDTIEKLATILDERRVVHVRGTPSSGKTTLAHLLFDYYDRRGEPVVFLNGWHNASEPTTYLISQCEAYGYSGIGRHALLKTNIVFIFDEAQQSYDDSSLWLGIIKTQSGNSAGPKICIFSSYGSPTTGPTKYPLGSTPIHFGAKQRISITPSLFADNGHVCLFYSQEEFEDVVSRACSNPTRTFALDPAACEYLYSITNGHPGATTALLEFIFLVCISFIYWSITTNTIDLSIRP